MAHYKHMAGTDRAQPGDRVMFEPGAPLLSHWLSGRVLNDRYAVLDVPGSGGMARVFRARDRCLGRFVAVTVLHPRCAGNSRFVDRFRRKAEFAAGVSTHPHMVTIHDGGEDGALRYIAKEYVAGHTLEDPIKERGAGSTQESGVIQDQGNGNGEGG